MRKYLTSKYIVGFVGSLLGLFIESGPKAWASFDVASYDVRWGEVSINGNGRYILFTSNYTNKVFLRDRLLQTTRRVDVASDGSEADLPGIPYNGSFARKHAISSNGRYIVFESTAENLLGPGVDTNHQIDVFLHDIVTGQTSIVSRPKAFPAIQANGDSFNAAISANGKKVVFTSRANNLLDPGVDSNGKADLFLFDVDTKEITRINVNSNGQQSTTGLEDYFLLYGIPNQDGTKIAFESHASDLVPGDSNPGGRDVFVRDLSTTPATTYRISVSDVGGQLNDESYLSSIDDEGCRIVFFSSANNVLTSKSLRAGHLYMRDLCQATPTTRWISQDFQGQEVSNAQVHSDGAISSNGQCIAFSASGSNLSNSGPVKADSVHFYLQDLKQGTIQLITSSQDLGTPEGSLAFNPAINADCSVVSFFTYGPNLLPGYSSKQFFNGIFTYSPIQLAASFTAAPTTDTLTIHFDSSNSQTQGGSITNYAWEFGDGTTSTEPHPTHTYANPGTYSVKLSILDNTYDHASTQQDVKVISSPASNGQLGGGGLDPGCSTHGGDTQDLASAWLSLLLFGSLLLIVSRFYDCCHRSRE